MWHFGHVPREFFWHRLSQVLQRLARPTRKRKRFPSMSSHVHEWQLRNLLGTLCQCCLFQCHYPLPHSHSVSTAADFEHQPCFCWNQTHVLARSCDKSPLILRLSTLTLLQRLFKSLGVLAAEMTLKSIGAFLLFTWWRNAILQERNIPNTLNVSSWHVANTNKNQQHCVRCVIMWLLCWACDDCLVYIPINCCELEKTSHNNSSKPAAILLPHTACLLGTSVNHVDSCDRLCWVNPCGYV